MTIMSTLPHATGEQLELLPSQHTALNALQELASSVPLLAIAGTPGMGRTTLLRRLARNINARLIETREISHLLETNSWNRADEAIHDFILQQMQVHDIVIIDDFGEIMKLGDMTNRRGLFRSCFSPSWRNEALHEGKRLIMAGNVVFEDSFANQFGAAAAVYAMPPLCQADYAQFLAASLGDGAVADMDFALLYRNAPMLDLYQLELLGELLQGKLRAGQTAVTTQQALALLERHVLQTNLQIEEVEPLEFSSLPGTEEIAEALESHVILPFQNREMAQELGLKPCRGVLLYGPPGTGKTSIGRALAHRMQGRFFLIDGSFVTEPPGRFLGAVSGVVEMAKAASPSVIFIDDADVLFQIEHIAGFSRYLLSLLDGIESETAGNVCVVMTAMDPSKVPEALLRSGRVELWLETKAPDIARRAEILRRWTRSDIPGFGDLDMNEIAAATEGFTPADLRRLSGEARLLHASDRVHGKSLRSGTTCFHAAIAQMIEQRDVMARQLADEALLIRSYA